MTQLATDSAPKICILLVEDDENTLFLLQRRLERVGYAIQKATSLTAARQTFGDAVWDLVILDRKLPDGDGVSLAREIRGRKPHAYILMLTGCGSDEAKLEGFAQGVDDYVTKPFETEELLARIRAGARIIELQKRLIESNKRLEELSLTDTLTELWNRRAFERELGTRFDTSLRYQRPLALAIIDVDHFKTINDTYGHPVGDVVLRAVAQTVEHVTREADLVARIGGEEFAVLLPETPMLEAIQLAEKVRTAVAATPIHTIAGTLHVTISLGVSSFPYSRFETNRAMVDAADQALYRAKARGRNRVEVERRRERVVVDVSLKRCVEKMHVWGSNANA
jgi:diguanylate cyclase (GGDEF)-like protein